MVDFKQEYILKFFFLLSLRTNKNKIYNGFYANANINISLMNTDQVLISCLLTLSEY